MQISENTHLTSSPSMLFFTCATGYYENFVLPYIYFAEHHNHGSLYEFIVSDPQKFERVNLEALAWLSEKRNVRPVLHDVTYADIKPRINNSLRFICQPRQLAEYVYIGDVDIIILEAIYSWHKRVFDAGLPYSNVVRPNTRRLSGLHFAIYEKQYPLPDISDIVSNYRNDEEILYAIMDRKKLLYSNELYSTVMKGLPRPGHGIHMSLHRLPFSAPDQHPNWGINYNNAKRFHDIFEASDFQEFFCLLPQGSRQLLLNLIYLTKGIMAYGKEFYKKNRVVPRAKPNDFNDF